MDFARRSAGADGPQIERQPIDKYCRPQAVQASHCGTSVELAAGVLETSGIILLKAPTTLAVGRLAMLADEVIVGKIEQGKATSPSSGSELMRKSAADKCVMNPLVRSSAECSSHPSVLMKTWISGRQVAHNSSRAILASAVVALPAHARRFREARAT